MKNKLILALLALAFVWLALNASSAFVQAASPPAVTASLTPALPTTLPCDENRTIQVSGQARFALPPEKARLLMEIETTGITPELALAASEASIQRLQDKFPKVSYLAHESGFQVAYHQESHTPETYQVKRVIALSVAEKDIESAVKESMQMGVVRILSIELSAFHADLSNKIDEARKKAMEDAKHKAEELAQATGTSVGCVLHITEQSEMLYSNDFGKNADEAGYGGVRIYDADLMKALESGKIIGEVTLSVTYGLIP